MNLLCKCYIWKKLNFYTDDKYWVDQKIVEQEKLWARGVILMSFSILIFKKVIGEI